MGKESCEQIASLTKNNFSVVRADHLNKKKITTPSAGDWVFRWGTLTTLTHGVRIVNEARAISWASDKSSSRIAMQDAGISVPESLAFSRGECENFKFPKRYTDNRNTRVDTGMYVGRQPTHSKGEHLVYGTFNDCVLGLKEWGRGGYIAKFIDKVEEYRVFLLQNRVIWVARKTPGNINDVAWNIAQGGHFENVPWKLWPIKVIEESVAAITLSGLDFGAVDAMVDRDGHTFILEINSAPLHSSEYRQSAVARGFDWIVANGTSEAIPPTDKWKGYSKWIHPCMY